MRALKSTNDFNNAHWFMPSDKKKCYSYIRWSSDKQSHGSTLERQLDIAREIADDYDLELVEIIDSGISAFKGANHKKGELGVFISAVDDGKIPNDSWLVVENLDRLSRQEITESQDLFMQLIRRGLTVVTGIDKRRYNKEIINNNPAELIYPIMVLSRANEESELKSFRTTKSVKKIIKRHLAGERAPDGNAFAINAIGNNRWWTDCSKKEEGDIPSVRPHPFYFPIAQEMIKLALKGHGSHYITRYLNENHPAPISNVKQRKGETVAWSLNRTTQFFTTKALLGEKPVKLNGDEYLLKDYYPPLCSEETFFKLRVGRESRNVKTEHSDKVYLFLGNKIIKCGHCGSAMTSHTTNENKEKGKYNKFRYKCTNTKANCRNWTFNSAWLDDTVLRLMANHVFRPANKSRDFDIAIKGIQENLIDKQGKIENLMDLAESGVATKSIPLKMQRLEQEIEQLECALESAQLNRATELFETVEWGEVDERVLDYQEHELRRKLKEKIHLSVKRVHCEQVRARLVKFTIHFCNDAIITAYRTPMTLVFDGNAWNELGDFYNKPAPVDKATLFKYQIEGDTTPVDKTELEDELGDLAEFIIDAPADNVGDNDAYAYKGLNDISSEMMSLLKTGEQPKQLLHDLIRAEHVADWANGFSKDVPKIIEDQYRVYKHKYKSHIAVKAKPAIRYIDDIEF